MNKGLFTATIKDGIIYKFDEIDRKYVDVGVDSDSWNDMIDERDKYYDLGVKHGYIKTQEQIEQEAKDLAEAEKKAQQDTINKLISTVAGLENKISKLLDEGGE